MKFVVLLTDNPDADANIRTKHMDAHLNFLDANRSAIEAAGPLFDNNNAGAGGIWIVTANDEATVQTLIEKDPFWATGLRQSVNILRWTQVFANGQRLVNT